MISRQHEWTTANKLLTLCSLLRLGIALTKRNKLNDFRVSRDSLVTQIYFLMDVVLGVAAVIT